MNQEMVDKLLKSMAAAGKAVECLNCGRVAVPTLVAETLAEFKLKPFCGRCAKELVRATAYIGKLSRKHVNVEEVLRDLLSDCKPSKESKQ